MTQDTHSFNGKIKRQLEQQDNEKTIHIILDVVLHHV